MSLVRGYLQEGGGNWATAKNTAVGSTVTINHVYLDKETFDNAYICVKGIYDSTGEEIGVRLGRQNVARIADVLGDNEKQWIGHKLKCITHQNYPGLGKMGLLWTGIKSTGTMQPRPGTLNQLDLSTEAHNWIVAFQSIIGQRIPDIEYNKIAESGVLKELHEKGIIATGTGINLLYPVLTEEARKYL